MNIFNTKDLYYDACRKSDFLHAMTDEERKNLQNHLRKMYLDIEEVCKNHNLQMMTAYGTVLGALRHKGFIPWDDDIDLMMPRKDYDLLIHKYAEDLPAQYKIYSPNSKNGPINRFAKVVDITTRFTLSTEDATEKDGIFIDIFPLENAVTSKLKIRWIQLVSCILMYIASSVDYWKSMSLVKKTLMKSSFTGAVNYYLRQSIGLVFCFFSPEKWYDIFDKFVTGRPDSGYYMIPSGGPKYRYFEPIAKSTYLPLKRLVFDDIEINVPNQSEIHCEIEYGDWMRIPPEDERGQHFIREIKFSI